MQSRLVSAALAAAALIATAGCAVQGGSSHVGSFVDDATITTKVKADIAADKNVEAGAIQVDGAVTLSGATRSALEKSIAESIAMKVSGVKQIRNEIAVRP